MEIIQNKYRITGFLSKKPGFTSYEAVNILNKENIILRKYDVFINSIEFDELKKQLQRLKENPIEKTAAILDITTDNSTGKLTVVFERPPGRPLSTFFGKNFNQKKNHPFSSTTAFLDLACKITELLKAVHKNDIPYLNVHPASIFIDGNDNINALPPSFSSFSILKSLPVEHGQPIENFMHYLAPEQIESYSEGIDFRTDFYSAGVLFYECLTGIVPFEDIKDIQSFINALVSKNPIQEKPPEIFPPILKIIEKLLSKSKEKRYQSVYGLKHDLTRCIEAYKEKDSIASFTPGLRDISGNFSISDKIYGRETELSRLLIAFYKAAKGYKENIFIKGEPGIGKTKLINEFQNNVNEAGGIVISGKFSRKNRQKPYSAFKDAFSQFIREVFTRGEDSADRLRESFRQNLKHNSKIISDFIPEISMLINPDDDPGEKYPVTNKNRFFTACRKFLESCLSYANPVILFLDDLHWADTASLELFSLISRYFQGGSILVICAFRNADNQSTKYLYEIMESMRNSYIPFEIIELEPLATHHISELVQDSFGNEPGENVALANLIFQQTGGNPFQIHQYIFSIHASKLIYYDFDSGIWKWNFDAVYRQSRQNFSNNYINEILKRFSNSEFELLATAACSGTFFSKSRLSVISDISETEIESLLSPAFYSGLIFKTKTNNNENYYFRHDNIQQTILDSMSLEERKKKHLWIARKLFSTIEKDDLESDYNFDSKSETLYETVYHFNKGSDFLPKEEKLEIARLNLRAAKNAIRSSSGSTALKFLENASSLLGSNMWKESQDLATQICIESGHSALLSGDYEKVRENAKKILLNNKNIISQLKAYELLISSQISDNKLESSIKSGIFILAKLGIKINEYPSRTRVVLSVLKTKFLLSSNPKSKIKNLRIMEDKIMITTMRILSLLLTPAYLSYPELHPVLSSLLVRISLKYGFCDETCYGLSAFGISVNKILNDYEYASSLGDLSIETGEINTNSIGYARSLIVNSIFLKHWQNPVNSCLPMLRKGKETAFELGDFEFGSHAIQALSSYSFFAGHPLANIRKELEIAEITLEQMGQKLALNHLRIFIKLTRIFLKESELRPLNHQEILSHPRISDDINETPDITGKFLINFANSFIYLYMNNIPKADKYWKEANKNIKGAASLLIYPYHLFIGALISLLKFEKITNNRYQHHIGEEFAQRTKKFRKFANLSPVNHYHRYILIKAEKARISKNFKKAEYFFQQAINLARENDLTQDEALFAERAYIFYRETDKSKTAYSYLNQAVSAYKKWGCLLKLSSLIGSENLRINSEINYFSEPDFPLRNFPKIFRALRLLSEKIIKSELILQLMDILTDISGATHGYFIELKKNIPVVSASSSADTGPEFYDPGASISSFSGILEPVVHNVFQTRQTFFPEQISREYSKLFTPEAEKIPKSVICLPVIRRQNLKGVIYLENIDIKNVFTQDKVELLTIICAHTAICLENMEKFTSLSEIIGDKKQAQNIIQETTTKLEERIKQRTQDLIKLNTKLQKEVEFKLKAEKALIQSETKYRTLVERMNDGLGVQDKNRVITYVNARMCAITGYSQHEMIGRKSYELLDRLVDDSSIFHPSNLKQSIVFEHEIKTKDNRRLTVLFQGQNLYDNEGNYDGSFAVITDITELKQLTLEIAEREEQIRALINATRDSVIMIDSEGFIITANKIAAKRFGFTPKEFIGKKIFDLFPENFIKHQKKYIREVTITGQIIRFQDSAGEFIYDITLYPVKRNKTQIDRIAVYAKDITELKKAEEQISSLTKEIIKAQENERKKIALDLHDHVAQNLSFLKITADSLKNSKQDDLQDKIQILSNGLKDSISDIRHISYDLRPPNLEELGLAKAIYQHCEDFSFKHGIEIDFTSAGMENIKFSFDIEINIFRIIQEALNNILKHSSADMARIRLIASYPRVILRIDDNGKGFDVKTESDSSVAGEKMGLKGMRERISLIGGQMEINSVLGTGTKIVAEIPYPELNTN
ncbi:MAG: PAS domain S-box protein [Desulfobacteraceae bacterium]|nr:PAS domain S-box protein [Desulfobacteraceae bacterium]